MAKRTKKPSEATEPVPVLPYIAEGLRSLAVPIDSVIQDPANARKHGKKNTEAIRASLSGFGQTLPLIASRATKIIIAGNCRQRVARELGWSHIAVVFVDYDNATALRYAIADNRIGEMGEWDEDVLNQLAKSMKDDDADLFNALDLDRITRALEEPAAEAAPAQAVPIQYMVVIECPSAADQEAEFRAAVQRGRKARVVTS